MTRSALCTPAILLALFAAAFGLGLLLAATIFKPAIDHAAVIAILLAVTLFAAATAFCLFWHLVARPLKHLGEHARNWRLGQDWSCDIPLACPEMRALQARLEDLNRRLNAQFRREHDLLAVKSRLVSVVSHELNNAISVIQVAAGILENPAETDETERERMLGVIKAQARSIALAVNNLLSLGRLESGRFAVSMKKVDLPALLRRCAKLIGVLCLKKELRLNLALPTEAPPVWADAEALTLVVANLLSNAVKYTPEHGAIWLGLRRDPAQDTVTVYVRDTGIGISPQDREHIFSEAFRCENGKAMAGGFGLGLSLARSILEAHGSRIELESSPGHGSTFSFKVQVWHPGLETEPAREKAAA